MKKFSLLCVLAGILLASCTPQEETSAPAEGVGTAVKTQAAPKKEVVETVPVAIEPVEPKAAQVPLQKNPVVNMVTSKGEILIELDAEKAPISVANFLSYVNDKFYDGTVFHRVIKDFMIQGGGMTPNLQKKPTKAPIKNESYNHLRNQRGTIAMARMTPPDSATSQFFINHVNNRSLDFDGPYKPGYAVFGKVVKGMDIVDAIAAISTKRVGSHGNVPVETVVIESIMVME